MNAPYQQWAESNLTIYGRFGDWYRIQCLNPEHLDAGPTSAQFNIASGAWHCFACLAKGSVANNPELSLLETKLMATRNRVRKREEAEEEEAPFQPEEILGRYKFKHGYWNARGINEDTQELFQLGYDAIADAVTIPLRDIQGRLLGVTRRFLDPEHFGPRYKYPWKFRASENLFASWLCEDYDMSTISVHEGSIDAMRLWQLGIPATALYGAAISEDHVQLFLKMGVRKIVYFGDSDKPGQQAKERARGYWIRADETYNYKPETDLSKHFVLTHVTNYHGKKDAGDMTDKQIIASWESQEPFTFIGNTRRRKYRIPTRKRVGMTR